MLSLTFVVLDIKCYGRDHSAHDCVEQRQHTGGKCPSPVKPGNDPEVLIISSVKLLLVKLQIRNASLTNSNCCNNPQSHVGHTLLETEHLERYLDLDLAMTPVNLHREIN